MPLQNRSDPQARWRGARHTWRLLACVVLVVSFAGGLAWAAAESAPAQGTLELEGLTPAAKLALLRAVSGPGGAWEPLHAGMPASAEGAASVGVWSQEAGDRVPADFLGLSFEATTLTGFSDRTRGGVMAHLLASLGHGTLRFGGGSVNRYVAFQQPGTPPPRWATHPVTPGDLGALGALARHVGWKVLLTMNLARYEPAAAAQEAASARREINSALAGIAVGNEPDRFGEYGLRAPSWNFSQYVHQLAAYRGAITGAAPGTRVAAPDVSTGEPPLPWVWESIGQHPAILTDHYYPLTACGHKPTATQLLSPEVRLQETVMLSTLADIQRTSRTPLELDETNDISCKGQPGVSNTFASALWAADYIARTMRAGLRGVDFHTLLNLPQSYSALVGEGASLHPNPEWYALLLDHSLQGARVLPTSVSAGSNTTAQAFRAPNGDLELLLVNFDPAGTRPTRVTLQLHGAGARVGTILRLTAPAVLATSGVKLGGEEVASTGRWHPRLPLPNLEHRGAGLGLSMPAASAALVTIPAP